MAIIQSGASTDLWTIDPTSKAGRVALYDTKGYNLAGFSPTTERWTYAMSLSTGATTQEISIAALASGSTMGIATLTTQGTNIDTLKYLGGLFVAKLRKVWVNITSCATATQIGVEIVRISGISSIGTLEYGHPFSQGAPMAKMVGGIGPVTIESANTFPTDTTTGTGTVVYNCGIITAPTTNNGVPTVITLWNERNQMDALESPISTGIRERWGTGTSIPGDGWAVRVINQGATATMGFSGGIIWSEEYAANVTY